jgi:hypothetical protein
MSKIILNVRQDVYNTNKIICNDTIEVIDHESNPQIIVTHFDIL